jgi:signal peptidase I
LNRKKNNPGPYPPYSGQQGQVQLPHGQMPPPHYPQGPYPYANYPHPYGPQPPGPAPESRKQLILRRAGLVGASAFLLIPFIILLAIFMLLVFIGRPYIVHGQSMQPTIHDGDRVFVVPYRGNTTPSREDVVVLRNIAGSPDMLIKRVVAIGGDRVTVENGDILVNDKYVHKSSNRFVTEPTTTMIPDNYVFVMGDNEGHSFDSRTFGPVSEGHIVGKALVIFWPPSDMQHL